MSNVFANGGYPTSMSFFNQYGVNRPGWEIIRQGLFDSAAYAAAGQSVLTFFQTPNGSGGKTLSDTNMTLAGQLPTAQAFLVEAIEILFLPTVPAVAAQNPAAFGAQAVANIVNDAYVFFRTGYLNFVIGSKPYLQEGPLGKFPSSRNFHTEAAAADISTTGANMQTRIAFAHSLGKPYNLVPLTLTSNQNFSVTLNWPEGVQPITNPGRVVVTLEGCLARQSQ